MTASPERSTDDIPGPLPESASGDRKKPGIDWNDPQVPIGNSPPLPRWPLAVAAFAWLAWVAFLIAMMLSSNAHSVAS